jgi:(p)ppGpp synthase/HD superfamily hydrolase
MTSNARTVTGDTLAGVPRDRRELASSLHVRGGSRFEEALVLANRLHWDQTRKATPIPYVGHLLGVASLVVEDGGTEDEVIAALLHDAVEDQGGAETLASLRRRFGDAVADIVDACSDTDQQPKPPWHERKQRYIDHLRTAPEGVLRVSAADKLHNARAILADHRRDGDAVFRRFSVPKDGTLAYYCLLDDIYRKRLGGTLADELHQVVEALLQATGSARYTKLPAHTVDQLRQGRHGTTEAADAVKGNGAGTPAT